MTVPEVGSSSEATIRRIVDFPHPEGPMIATNSFGETWRSIRSTASRVSFLETGKRFETPTSRTSLFPPARGSSERGSVAPASAISSRGSDTFGSRSGADQLTDGGRGQGQGIDLDAELGERVRDGVR